MEHSQTLCKNKPNRYRDPQFIENYTPRPLLDSHQQSTVESQERNHFQEFEEECLIYYISNLAETVTDRQVNNYFCQFGTVKCIKLAKLPDGSCKGYAKLSIQPFIDLSQKFSLNCHNSQALVRIPH
jgi:RNA recognition motif-containing protein